MTPPPPISPSRSAVAPPARLGLVGIWGIVGVAALLVQAVLRLTPRAVESITGALGALHVAALVAWVGFSVYTEGYRAFQKQFSPRVVARAQHLSAHPRLIHVILAPVYCMGLVHATRRRLIVSWVVTLCVIAAIAAVKTLAQPWRGIIDAGVVVALAWGIAALAYFTVRALAGHRMAIDPDVP